MKKQSCIALLCREYEGISSYSDGLKESRHWVVNPSSAHQYIGGTISFHNHQKEESYERGIIEGFYLDENHNGYQRRVIFIYRPIYNLPPVRVNWNKSNGRREQFRYTEEIVDAPSVVKSEHFGIPSINEDIVFFGVIKHYSDGNVNVHVDDVEFRQIKQVLCDAGYNVSTNTNSSTHDVLRQIAKRVGVYDVVKND